MTQRIYFAIIAFIILISIIVNNIRASVGKPASEVTLLNQTSSLSSSDINDPPVLNIAVIASSFANSPNPNPFNLTLIREFYQNSSGGFDVSKYFQEVSYGKTVVNATVYGTYHLSVSSTDPASGCSSLIGMGNAIIQAADSTINFTGINRIVYLVDCDINFGAYASGFECIVATGEGNINVAEAWFNNYSYLVINNHIHELAHDFNNLQHANYYVCLPDSFNPPTFFGPNCISAAYGSSLATLQTNGWFYNSTNNILYIKFS